MIAFYYFQKYIPKFEDQIAKKVVCRSDNVDPLDVRKYILKFLNFGRNLWYYLKKPDLYLHKLTPDNENNPDFKR